MEQVQPTKKIFNLSLPKSATSSVGAMVKSSGYRVCDGLWSDHKTNFLNLAVANNDFSTVDKVVKQYDFFSDIPFSGTSYCLHALDKYPDAKFFMIYRDNQSWFTSLLSMIDNNILGGEYVEKSLQEKVNLCFEKGRYGFAIWLSEFCQNDFTENAIIEAKIKYDNLIKSRFSCSDNFESFTLSDLDEQRLKSFLNVNEDIGLKKANVGKYHNMK